MAGGAPKPQGERLDPRRDPRQLAQTKSSRGPRPGTQPPTPAGPGATRWLAGAVLLLVALIAIGRLNRPDTEPTLPVVARAETTAARVPPPPPALAPAPTATPAQETSAVDLLVRLEARRRVQRAGTAVYLDSLFAESDSVLRRWPERPGQPVTVAFARDSLFELTDGGDAAVRDAFARWLALSLDTRVLFVDDTTDAEIVVGWRDRFDESAPRTGQTDLEVAADGAIQRGRITLALYDPKGKRLDRQATLVTAVHEIGHALGLAHSANPGDIMFPSPRSPALSERDRRTVELIYSLPPGSVKEQ